MEKAPRRLFDIVVSPEKCTACFICQLRCSWRFTRSFNPAEAALVVNPHSDRLGAKITFTPKCDQCLLCARYCPYGALELRRREVTAAHECR